MRTPTGNRTANLTARLVASLAPGLTRYEIADTEIPGLRLRVTPAGVATYTVSYRSRDGRRARLRLGDARQITVKQARDAARAALGQAALGGDPAADQKRARHERARAAAVPTLRAYAEGPFADAIKVDQRSGAATVARLLAAFPAALLDRRLPDVTRWHLQAWRKQRREAGVSDFTIDRDLAALGTLFSYATAAGLLTESPLRKPASERKNTLRPRLDTQQAPRYLSPAEEDALRKALAARDARMRAERDSANRWRKQRHREPMPALGEFADHLTPMCLLVLNTGLRPGRELFELEWSAVDLHHRVLTVTAATAKANRSRAIRLNAEALSVLRTWQKVTRAKAGLVFPNADGRPFDNIKKAWAGVAAAAGLGDLPPYSLRHTFASRLVAAGVSLPIVQRLMGHADIRVTMRYIHVADADLDRAVTALLDRREEA